MDIQVLGFHIEPNPSTKPACKVKGVTLYKLL